MARARIDMIPGATRPNPYLACHPEPFDKLRTG
jgi:hypothetical protein